MNGKMLRLQSLSNPPGVAENPRTFENSKCSSAPFGARYPNWVANQGLRPALRPCPWLQTVGPPGHALRIKVREGWRTLRGMRAQNSLVASEPIATPTSSSHAHDFTFARAARGHASIWILLLCLSMRSLSASQSLQPFSDLLQFLDGAALHGKLHSVDLEQGLQWEHPAARQVLKLKPTGLAWIKFEQAQRVETESQPTCWFQFNNGDEIFGRLKSLDAEKLQLETWFGGNLEAPREALESVTFFSKGYSILYEGPNGVDGWKLSPGPRGWRYSDGAFLAKNVGILGRDLKLSGSSSIEFDLAWNGHFSLSFILYTEAFDRFDYSVNSYMFHMAPGYVNLQRVQVGSGVLSLGPQVQIPDMIKKNKVRLQIRTNAGDATISLWADGVLAHRWKDPSGFVAKGSGIVFSSQMEGPTLRLSNFKVAQWDGSFEPEPAPASPAKEDAIFLANRDKVGGRLQGIKDGQVTFAIPMAMLEIPLPRVTQIFLAQTKTNATAPAPWEIKVEVAGGGTVAFRLDKWSEDRVAGTSSNFGRMAVNPLSIRRVQFNLEKHKKAEDAELTDGEAWDVNE